MVPTIPTVLGPQSTVGFEMVPVNPEIGSCFGDISHEYIYSHGGSQKPMVACEKRSLVGEMLARSCMHSYDWILTRTYICAYVNTSIHAHVHVNVNVYVFMKNLYKYEYIT